MQQDLKAQCDQREAELSQLRTELATTQNKLASNEGIQSRLQAELAALASEKTQGTVDGEKLKAENERLLRRISDMEVELKAQERKHAMLAKDYQKQLAKSQKQSTISNSNDQLEDEKFKLSGDAVADNKKLLTELQAISRENGNLSRKLAEFQTTKAKTDEDVCLKRV
jgi:chromosome segregation ATPase